MNRREILTVRIAASVFLIGLALILLLGFGSRAATPEPAMMHFAGGDELAADYAAYLGSRVELYGKIVGTDPVVIRGRYGGRDLTLTIVDVGSSPDVGEYLHVYGVVESELTIRAIDTVVYPATGILVTYAVSGIAGLWTVGRFVNRWRFDPADLSFQTRERRVVRPLADALRRITGGRRG